MLVLPQLFTIEDASQQQSRAFLALGSVGGSG